MVATAKTAASRLVVVQSTTNEATPRDTANTSACVREIWSRTSGRLLVRFITESMSASMTQFSALALPAAIVPPTRVHRTSQSDGTPRWASSIAGIVVMSSCSTTRGLIRDR